MADETTTTETRADKLDRLLKKAGLKTEGDRGAAGAPYVFSTLADGRTRLTVENPETGDRMGFVGTDHDDVIAQLEARVGG